MRSLHAFANQSSDILLETHGLLVIIRVCYIRSQIEIGEYAIVDPLVYGALFYRWFTPLTAIKLVISTGREPPVTTGTAWSAGT